MRKIILALLATLCFMGCNMDAKTLTVESEDKNDSKKSYFTFHTEDLREKKYFSEEGYHKYIWYDLWYYEDKIFQRCFGLDYPNFEWPIFFGVPSFKVAKSNTKTSEAVTFLRIESPEYLKAGITHFELTLYNDYAELYNSYTDKTTKLEYINEVGSMDTYEW